MNTNIGEHNYNVIKDYWQNNSNILIYENKEIKADKCIIYASSNGIWHPNTIEAFQRIIITEQRFEWKNLGGGVEGFKKYIFIRDIWKEWYVHGINSVIDNIDKLIAHLKNETRGCQVVTIGNSAGGYLAAILGMALSAEYVLDFSGQFNIWCYSDMEEEYPELYSMKDDNNINKYYNLVPQMKASHVPIIYFYAANCQQDVEQYQFVKTFENIYPLAFDTYEHGESMYPFNFPYVIAMDKSKWMELAEEYKNMVISKKMFAYRTLSKKVFTYHYIIYAVKKFPKNLKKRVINWIKNNPALYEMIRKIIKR